MSVSFSCEQGQHTKCIRPSCECFCGHPHRVALEARADELLARPAPGGTRPASAVPVSRPSPRVTKPERAPRPRARPRTPTRSTLQIDVDDLVRRYQAGATLRDLAEHYHCSHEAVRSRLAGAGIELRRGRGVPIDLPIDDLVAAYDAGATAKQLAVEYGTSANTILCRLRAAGATLRAQGDRSITLPDVEIAAAYQAGATLEALAARYQVSASTIANHLRACDIEIRRRGRLEVDTDELWRLYQTGLSTEHLALRFKVGTYPLTVAPPPAPPGVSR